jgi:hypothetical protein
VSQRSVRVLLDASAIVTFTRGISVDVGEVIGEVNDEGAAAGLPLLCLVEARRAIADTDLLDLLVNHQATTIVPPHGDSWRALCATYDTVGRLDAASAVLAAYDLDCLILTAQPALYAGLASGGPIIALPPP